MLLVFAGLALLAGAAAMIGLPGKTHRGPLPALTPAEIESVTRLRKHVAAVASREPNL